MLQRKGVVFSFHNYFLLGWGTVPKLLRHHIPLTLTLRVSDPGPPSNSWRGCGTHRSLDNHFNLKAFGWLETHPVTQLQMQGANNKNRTIRIIIIKIVIHHGELVNVSQYEVTEASGESRAWIILFMCLVKWVTLVLISGIYVQHWVWIMAQVPPCAAIRIPKANLFL